MAIVVGTWPFSLEAVKLISRKLREGNGCIDALESGINCNLVADVFVSFLSCCRKYQLF